MAECYNKGEKEAIMYHISDLKKYSKCHRLYYLDLQNKDKNYQPYLRSDESFTSLLKLRLKVDEEKCFTGKVGDDSNKFIDNLANYEWFVHARCEYGELRIKVPFLHKREDKYDIYFTYHGTQLRDLDLFTYRITIDVLGKYGIEIGRVYVVYINPEYVFHNQQNPRKLFVITNKINGSMIKGLILSQSVDYESLINEINNNNVDTCVAFKSRQCHARDICKHYYECFEEESSIEDDSILTLVSSRYKNDMYKEGIRLLKDADLNRVEGNRVQYAQIRASKNGGLFVDKYNLKKWLDKLEKKPLSYIDFEWDRYLIPAYEGMKPLDVIPFEYVLYIDDGSEELIHKTFISSGDCRKKFVRSLINDLPKDGYILAYNASGAEVLRLKELSRLYPEYKDELDSIINRFVDLAIPFIDGLVYDTRMAGVYSLKKLVSIVSDMSYKDLDVNDGMQAVYSWRDIDTGESIDKQKAIEDLIKYCSLDAYGLALVYNYLKSLI